MSRKFSAKTLKAWRQYCEEIRPQVTAEMVAQIKHDEAVLTQLRALAPPGADCSGTSFVFPLYPKD